MRLALCQNLIRRFHERPFVFLTADLGFMALEPLREVMGLRFINVGISEQNMVGLAAGLAKGGEEVWIYSIGPFLYARAFEQIRNDLGPHLPVRLLGYGGGYAYGVQGPTHHALEDLGVLLSLNHMTVVIPAFRQDIAAVTDMASRFPGPIYYRLARHEAPNDYEPPAFAPWRCLHQGSGPVVVAVGPLAGQILLGLRQGIIDQGISFWLCGQLPLEGRPLPTALVEALRASGDLAVVEEHVPHGGVGQTLATMLAGQNIPLKNFKHLYAAGYPSDRYGSQGFHRHESGLDVNGVASILKQMV